MTKRAAEQYQVIVGNIGCVYDGTDFHDAVLKFGAYRDQSLSGRGRAGEEDVTLLVEGEPVREYYGTLNDEDE